MSIEVEVYPPAPLPQLAESVVPLEDTLLQLPPNPPLARVSRKRHARIREEGVLLKLSNKIPTGVAKA